MYAVIETGGKQYRVEQGAEIEVELLGASGGTEGDEGPSSGDAVEFDRVLLVSGDDGVKVGSPLVDGASVKGTLIDETRADKIKVFKFKRRKGYRRTTGHRQHLHRVRIDEIAG